MIAIVGAGVSGLALGLELARQGAAFRILEAGDEVGGVIRTVEVEGHRVELGPQRVRAVSGAAELLDEMPGPHHRTPDLPVMVVRGGELHPLPRTLGQALATRAVSFRGKVRGALEPVAALRTPPPGVSAGRLLRQRLGDEIYRTFAGPLLGGLYGSDPEFMDAHRTLIPAMETLGVGSLVARLVPGLRGRARSSLLDAPVVVPAGGMTALPRYMAARLNEGNPDALHLACPVRSLRPASPGTGYRLETPRGTLSAREVVLTLPSRGAAELVGPLDAAAGRILGDLRTNPLALVHLEVPRLPPALGFQVAFGEPHRARGATFSGNFDGSGRTAVVFLGGMADPEFPSAPDGELSAVATAEFGELTGIPARSLHVHRTRMPAWDRSWRGMDALSLPPGVHLLTNYSGRPGILGRLAAARELARKLVAGAPPHPPRARRTAQ